MRQTRILLCGIVVAAMIFAAGKARAFPLYLTSASGSITATAHFGSSTQTTSNKVESASINLKKLMTLVSNEVSLRIGTNVPVDVRIAFDPFLLTTYLTNSSGFYHNLSGIAKVSINEIATS